MGPKKATNAETSDGKSKEKKGGTSIKVNNVGYSSKPNERFKNVFRLDTYFAKSNQEHLKLWKN
jgi:hypothetical protein